MEAVDIIAQALEKEEKPPELPWSYDALTRPGRWPKSCVVGIATVTEARKLTDADNRAALCLAAGLNGLILSDVMALRPPLGHRGCQGVWKWNPEVELWRVICPHCYHVLITTEVADLSAKASATANPRARGKPHPPLVDCTCGFTFSWRNEGNAEPFTPD